MRVMTDIRLVGCDMDGTLLNSERVVSVRSLNTIERVIKSGVVFAAVTGRPLYGLPERLRTIQAFRYCVLANGATVYDLREGRIIAQQLIPVDAVHEIAQITAEYRCALGFMSGGMLYLSGESMELIRQKYASDAAYVNAFFSMWKRRADAERVFEERVDRIEKFNLDFLDDGAYRACLARLKRVEGAEISCNTPRYVELTARNCNKGSGLKLLMEHLGLADWQVMVMGDSDNDRSMFTPGRTRVAVRNAEPEIRALADYITLDHDEDGVAYALETLLLGERTGENLYHTGG